MDRNVHIRAAGAHDRAAVEAVAAEAFGEPPGGRVVRMMRALHETGATRIALVADDEGVVGHVLLSRAWIDARQRLLDALMLTPLAVAPRSQGRGVGTRLLAAALDAAAATDAAAVLLEGDPAFYGPRGFQPGRSLGLRRPSNRIPQRAFQVVLLPRHERWMTGRVVYPDAMWTTDTVGLRDPLLESIEGMHDT